MTLDDLKQVLGTLKEYQGFLQYIERDPETKEVKEVGESIAIIEAELDPFMRLRDLIASKGGSFE